MPTNKKLIFEVLTILTLLAVGFFVWQLLTNRPGYPEPKPHSYFTCPDGSQHQGVPDEGVQKWCEKYGFTIIDVNNTMIEENKEKYASESISGYVVSGGDTTPKGLYDTPRRFVYKIRKDDGTNVNVGYTAYPPSPSGNRKTQVRWNLYSSKIRIGDYLKARGTYNRKIKVLFVANKGDYIETYPEKQ